jgi:hypothetical protein
MAETDPFSQVHEALWTMLLARTDLAGMVAVGNRRKIVGVDVAPPVKPALQHADVPQLWIEPAGAAEWAMHDHASGMSDLQAVWKVELVTGYKVADTIHQLNWAVFRAAQAWRTHLRDALTWKTKPFVRACRCRTAKDALDNYEASRGKHGWVTFWLIETDLQFDVTNLLEAV